MSYCPNCKTKYTGGEEYCTECGVALIKEQPAFADVPVKDEAEEKKKREKKRTKVFVIAGAAVIAAALVISVVMNNSPAKTSAHESAKQTETVSDTAPSDNGEIAKDSSGVLCLLKDGRINTSFTGNILHNGAYCYVEKGIVKWENVKVLTVNSSNGGAVVIREYMGNTSPELGSVPSGTTVAVEKTEEGWAHVAADGIVGWCPELYLSSSNEERIDEKFIVDYASSGAVLYDGPGSEARILKTVSPGTEITASARRGDFLNVTHEGINGWCASSELITPESAGELKKCQILICGGSRVNIRELPDGKAETVCQVDNGTIVTAYKQKGNWIYVSCGEMAGWCHKAYMLEIETPLVSVKYKTPSHGDKTAIHAGKSTGSKQLAALAKDASVLVTVQSDGWGFVSSKGVSGWVELSRLTPVNK